MGIMKALPQLLLVVVVAVLNSEFVSAQDPTIICTKEKDCFNNATAVIATPTGCNCTCRTYWYGRDCANCPEAFDRNKDCNACREGYLGQFPNCTRGCGQANCSYHADIDNPITLPCNCNCRNNWTSADCSVCPYGYDASADCAWCIDGYDDYPHCSKKCGSENCSNNAESWAGTYASGCTCNCSNHWYGDNCANCPTGFTTQSDCSLCAYGYEGENCTAKCLNSVHCNNRARDMTGSPPNCVCICRNSWTGPTCLDCPPNVDSSQDCAMCKSGFVDRDPSPTSLDCVLGCTVQANCSNHASEVSGNSIDGCTCTCRNSWNGTNCSLCPDGVDSSTNGDCLICVSGYDGYPNCVPTCFENINCNGRASSVSGTPPNCLCKCRNSWTGPACEDCPGNINPSSDCALCKSGFGPAPPVCNRSCTSALDCNGHASGVSGFYPNCTCTTCKTQWVGAKCDQCPTPFAGTNCDGCMSGYTGYPNCGVECTVANCTAGAASAYGNYNCLSPPCQGCGCRCRSNWFGSTCKECPWNWDASQDCASCTTGLVGTGCWVPCTAANCSNHADSVEGNSNTSCVCNCSKKWSGPTCATCPSNYNASLDCGECADGYDEYPACTKLCTDTANCRGRATYVSGVIGKCNCTCRNSWFGSTCQSCPQYVNVSDDCESCVSGTTGYPNCQRNCDVTLDCSGHATSVDGIKPSSTPCNCSCRNSWTGLICNSCPSKFDPSVAGDCGRCATGYGGTYPECRPMCTNVSDCSSRAKFVSGVYPSCSCECRNSWTGSNCGTCPTGFSASSDCSACATGYDGYPDCSPLCTYADCYNHATGVNGTQLSGCGCNCTKKWTGKNCSICPTGYNATADCGMCEDGYTGYPACTRGCELAGDCSPNAVSVSGDFASGCQCACRSHWTGARCTLCPPNFDPNQDCAGCADGYEDYPACVLKCTLSNCSNNADNVTGNAITGCNCSCRNKWSGRYCDFCPPLYDGTEDCANCTDKSYHNFPVCDEGCFGMGYSMCPPNYEFYGNDTFGCFCRCVNCSGGPGGCMCAYGMFGQLGKCPPCTRNRNCSALIDCSNRSISEINGTLKEGCNCTCRNMWNGTMCQDCPVQFDEANDCSGCGPDYEGEYPDCYKKCSQLDCSGHADSVTGNENSGCSCNCSNAWSGPTCSFCPTNFDNTTDCSSCAEGFEDYPNCYWKCTNEWNCSGHASTVSGNDGPGGCRCTCKNEWRPPDCGECPDGIDSSRDCRYCIAGYGDYPTCSPLCGPSNCSNHGTASGTYNRGCSCDCAFEWTGDRCETCPTGFDASTNCSSCIAGYFGYPSCTRRCTNDDDCSGHADNITGNGTVGCDCDCRNQWTFPKCSSCAKQFDNSTEGDCGRCAVGYSGSFPFCYEDCTMDDCNNHATNVSGNTGTGCNCTCENSWVGRTCLTCPTGIDAESNCKSCKSGFDGYPKCVRMCNNTSDCSGHAKNVTGTVSSEGGVGCNCTCRNRWTGVDCGDCPAEFDPQKDCNDCNPLYEGTFPDCKLLCTKVDNCNNHADGVSGNVVDGCVCECMNKWSEDDCSVCKFPYQDTNGFCATCANGYSEFPFCYQDCTAIDNCTNHSASVSGNSKTGCTCTCRAFWKGASCSVCKLGYDTSKDCDACADGYTNYPNCSRECTNTLDCSSHAAVNGVSGTTFTGCNCTCLNAWTGDDCSECPEGIERTNCGSCIAGWIGYPTCEQECNITTHCSGHAGSVNGTVNSGCHCKCSNAWAGDDCSTCPDGVDLSANCGACKSGYQGYPNCTRLCLPSDCTLHADYVSGYTYSGCNCTCRNQWDGSDCSMCPSQFDPQMDCGWCSYKYSGYPNCVRPCENYDDCSSHAEANGVTGIWPNCNCSCRNQWRNATCGECPFPFDSYPDCNRCVNGYADYPNCDIACTNEGNCSSHAKSGGVEGTVKTGCTCKCRNQWKGENCAVCPPEYHQLLDCSGCSDLAEGDYPNCKMRCTPTYNCSNHATEVSGNWVDGCFCTCAKKWGGLTCSDCDDIFNRSLDCGACADGYVGYPNCTKITTTAEPTTTTTTVEPTTTTTTEEPTTTTEEPTNTTEEPATTTEEPMTSTEEPTTTTLVPTTITEEPTTTEEPATTIEETTATTKEPTTITEEPTTTTEKPTTTITTTTTEAPTTTTTSTESPTTTEAAVTTEAPTTTKTELTTTTTTTTTEPPTEAPTTTTTTTTEVPTTTTQEPTTTPAPTTTTTTSEPQTTTEQPTIPSECTVEASCSGRATAVVLTDTGCNCTCRNQWSAADCSVCTANFDNSSKSDCGKCAEGFSSYPVCLCTYHVTGDMNVTVLPSFDTVDESTRIAFLKAFLVDFRKFLATACVENPVQGKDGYVVELQSEVAARVLTVTFDAEVTDGDCGRAQRAAQCLLDALSKCFPLDKTVELTGNATCGAPNVTTSRQSPCGNDGGTCAAAEDHLLAWGWKEEEGSLVWLWILIAVLLLLILFALWYWKRRHQFLQKYARIFSDPTKYTKEFNVMEGMEIAEDIKMSQIRFEDRDPEMIQAEKDEEAYMRLGQTMSRSDFAATLARTRGRGAADIDDLAAPLDGTHGRERMNSDFLLLAGQDGTSPPVVPMRQLPGPEVRNQGIMYDDI